MARQLRKQANTARENKQQRLERKHGNDKNRGKRKINNEFQRHF